jgi:hypothetical protein
MYSSGNAPNGGIQSASDSSVAEHKEMKFEEIM